MLHKREVIPPIIVSVKYLSFLSETSFQIWDNISFPRLSSACQDYFCVVAYSKALLSLGDSLLCTR